MSTLLRNSSKEFSVFMPMFSITMQKVYLLHINLIFEDISYLGMHVMLNNNFKHFYSFITEFSLLKPKDLVPLQHIIDSYYYQYKLVDAVGASNSTHGTSQNLITHAHHSRPYWSNQDHVKLYDYCVICINLPDPVKNFATINFPSVLYTLVKNNEQHYTAELNLLFDIDKDTLGTMKFVGTNQNWVSCSKLNTGEGGFSVVYQCRWNGMDVAMKQIKFQNDQILKLFRRESALM